jgi:hypothetical protein
MNYFVAVNGETIKDNITRESAIKTARDVLTERPELGTINVGIGRYKYQKGVKTYCMLPCHFYF